MPAVRVCPEPNPPQRAARHGLHRRKNCQNGQRPAGDQETGCRIEPGGPNQGRSAWRKAVEITEQTGGIGSQETGEDVSAAAEADTDTAGEVEPAGHFRIYLGAAPGVGKTYAMLSEGQRRRSRGADVVAGFVETYGRPLTEALLNGYEIIPRKAVDYRGTRLEEMDLDAVLRRRPEVALVDELAHTNVPGSGWHDKRWQDVLDILGAGINVITTVNIQHLESLADEVEQMTGAPVRERVPDWVVRKASQIELIDSSPQQLRRRMLHGNIYPKNKVPQALTHFAHRTEVQGGTRGGPRHRRRHRPDPGSPAERRAARTGSRSRRPLARGTTRRSRPGHHRHRAAT